MNIKSLAIVYQKMIYANKFFEPLNTVNANKNLIGKSEGA
jgi:hypothetical protein